jgi:hypothetical protein
LASLPSQAEKDEIHAGLDTLVEFLLDLQKDLDSIPAAESLRAVDSAITRLEEILRHAEAKPAIAAVLGVRPASVRPTSSKVVATDAESVRARATLDELQKLPIDQLRSRLDGSEYSMSELRVLASLLGIRATPKLNRDSLTQQVTMKIANYRGYRQLGGDDSQVS